jgi:hypothetical protein
VCGQNSASVSPKSAVTGGAAIGATKNVLFFVVDQYGNISESHSRNSQVAGLKDNAAVVKMNYRDGEIVYEGSKFPKFYTKAVKAATEATVIANFKKLEKAVPAYVAKLAALEVKHQEAIEAAVAAADKALAAGRKAAFAPISKLGGIQG